jgi:hypothetical protein
MPSNKTKYDVIYLYLLTTIVSAYIWPSSGQNINLESKYSMSKNIKQAMPYGSRNGSH